MADDLTLYVSEDSELVFTGKGHVTGMIVTSSETEAGGCMLYDAPTDSGGPKIFECMVTVYGPQQYFFKDQFSPRFHDGLFIHLGVGVYATIYVHTSAY
jgi:hypothetical protein